MLLNFSNLEGVSHCFIEVENLRYVNIPHRANLFNREKKLLIIGSRTLCAKNNCQFSVTFFVKNTRAQGEKSTFSRRIASISYLP